MSIIKITTVLLSVALMFVECTTQIVKNDNYPALKAKMKISLLVASRTEKECIAYSKQLEDIIKENHLESIYENCWMVFSGDPLNTDALRIAAEENNAALVLMKNEPGGWNVITIKPNSKQENEVVDPPITVLSDNEVGKFLSAFLQYYSSNFDSALELFTALENPLKDNNRSGEISFWIGSTFIQLDKKEKAISILEDALSAGTLTNKEVKGAALLAIARLLTPEIVYDTLTILKPKRLFIEAAELLRGFNGRYWAFTQTGLGKLILLSAKERSRDDILAALNYFENAEMILVYPKDDLNIAKLHLLTGRAYIILAQKMKETNVYIDKALYHFEVTKEIWYKHDDKEIELEGLSHEINFTNSLRR